MRVLTQEPGESGPLFLKSHQPFRESRERHPTPLAISSEYHFGNIVDTLQFSPKSVSGVICWKNRPHFRMKRRYTAGNLLVHFFFSASGNIVKKSNDARGEKKSGSRCLSSKVSTLRRASGSTPGVTTRESTHIENSVSYIFFWFF